jgi:hypothetical protein
VIGADVHWNTCILIKEHVGHDRIALTRAISRCARLPGTAAEAAASQSTRKHLVR